MAFWGIEIKPDKPYVHRPDDEGGRLHVSQATLGAGSSAVKSIVQCKVGNKTPIYLCSLLPEKLETCALNLEFEEEDEVTLSVVGDLSVHLSGFFYGDNEDQDNQEDEYGSDPYEEDVMVTDSDDEDDSSSFESDDEIGDDGFHTSSPPPVSNSGVRIEEIVDDDKTTDGDGMSKKANNKRIRSVMSGDDENSNQQIVVKAGTKSPLSESEDEDGFPISAYEKKPSSLISDMKSKESPDKAFGEKVQKKNVKSDVGSEKNFKKQIDAVSKDGEHARETIETCDSSAQPDDKVKKRKNKKKKVADKIDGSQDGKPNSNVAKEAPVADVGNDLKTSSETKKEKKGNKKNNQQETAATPNAIEKPIDGKGSVLEKQETREAKSLQVRSFPNGLVIEELGMGKPAGKRASPGKKVSVHYIGKLKKDGKIFDSNIGRPPFKFRLGIGEVIKGWDVGVNGMRVGDKRRLTIPPTMGYGAKGCGPKIPPNSWLVFDVELDDVK